MTNAVTLAQLGTTNNTFRNRIINGNMAIDQRYSGGAITPTAAQYVVDRWSLYPAQASKLSVQQSSIAPAGFTKSLSYTSQSAYALLAGDFFLHTQLIEGYNVADLAWGTASAQTITISFWVRSSINGTFGGSIRNATATRSYPFTYTITNANTFEYKTVTIPGDTTGTWNTDNTTGLQLAFNLGTGTTYSGTAGSWSSNNYVSVTGATSIVGTNGATWYITGVQLEAGTSATPFENRPYGTELALCQRYYQLITSAPLISGYGSVTVYADFSLPVVMRTSPTGSLSGTFQYGGGASNYSFNASYPDHWRASLTTTGTQYGFGYSGVVAVSAEL